MTFTIKKLADIQYIPSSAGSIFTNPADTTTGIKSIVLFNGNTTAETVKLYAVPNSGGSLGTAGPGNIFFQQDIAPNETRSFVFDGAPLCLDAENDSIQAVTTTGSKVTVLLAGAQDA